MSARVPWRSCWQAGWRRAAFDWHVPWANDAAAKYIYTLPSGAECTGIVGNVTGPPDAVAAANAFLGRDDLIKTIDIDAALALERQGPNMHDDNGT